jgi:integrase
MAGDVVRITKRIVDEAKPGERDVFVRDAELRGFALKITPAGAKSYVVEYRMPGGRGSAKGRYTIGKHSSPWTPDSARKEAMTILEGVRKGINPMTLKRDKHQEAVDLAFDRYVDLFIDKYCKREQVRSWQQAKAMFAHDICPVWKSRPVSEISRKDIASLLANIADDRPPTARYAHAMLRKLFRWAVGRGDIETNPMADMPPPAPTIVRDRILSDGELVAVWNASKAMDPFYGPAVRLLIATGQRRDEVIGMSFDELDLQSRTWTIPAIRSKNGLASIVPLNDLAMAELETLGVGSRKRGLVFTTTGTTPISGMSKFKNRLDGLVLAELRKQDDLATLTAWRIHDIRRTVATGLQKLGVRFEVTESILNHVSGAKSGVAGVYQRYDWAPEKRDALDAWGRRVAALVTGEKDQSNIVPMRRV